MAILRDIQHSFVHALVDFGSVILFDWYVNAPVNHEEARHHMKEVTEAGLNGTGGLTDCMDILTGGCE
jgi:hypothetical protein